MDYVFWFFFVLEAYDVIWNGGLIRNKMVCLVSVQYIFYASLQSPITCGRGVKEL